MSASDPIDHERYAEWDAAYVLGSLPTAERLEYERHLESCPICRQAVADFAALPGLLGKVPTEDAFALLDRPDAVLSAREPAHAAVVRDEPAPLLLPLLHRVRRRRTARRWVLGGVSTLAAAAIAAAIVLPVTLTRAPEPTAQLALTQTVPSPLTATVALTGHDWGTGVTMTCSYAASASATPYPAAPREYQLYVTDATGHASLVSSWSAEPGRTVHTAGSTAVPEAQLASVQVRDAQTGTVLLSSPVGPTISSD